MKDLLAFAAKNGATTVFLEVRDGNTPAQKLYEKLGFLPIGVRRGYYDDAEGGDAIVMKTELAESEV